MISVQGLGESSGIQVFTKDHGGFTPEEIANRVLAGIDVKLGPEQDLDGFIGYVDYIISNDDILGQFNEEQTIMLARKQQEAQQMKQALQEMAAQQANAQQMQRNAAMSQQQTSPAMAQPAAGAPGAPGTPNG